MRRKERKEKLGSRREEKEIGKVKRIGEEKLGCIREKREERK